MQRVRQERIDGLIQPANTARTVLDVSVFVDELHDFVVIRDPEDKTGMSITNGAEYFVPQIVERLELRGPRCIFIESYPASEAFERYDATFDRICVAWPAVQVYSPLQGRAIPSVELVAGGWRPLSLSIAKSLQAAGCTLSRFIGRRVRVADAKDDIAEFVVAAYDGRDYYDRAGKRYVGRITAVADASEQLVPIRRWLTVADAA